MQKTDSLSVIPDERITDKIYLIRGKKVMLDRDLALLYAVQTKQLNRAVLRNQERFPEDFMFQLSQIEIENLRCQIGTSNGDINLRSQIATSKERRGGRRYLPYVFTEHGILMLSSVLNSPQAIQVNIQIMRTFTRLRELMATNELLRQKIEAIEKIQGKHDKSLRTIFRVIQQLLREDEKPKNEIGFKER